jgi:hypothetical protein
MSGWNDFRGDLNPIRSSSMNVNAPAFQYNPPSTPNRSQSVAPFAMRNRQASAFNPNQSAFRPTQPSQLAPFGNPSPSSALVRFNHQQDDGSEQPWGRMFQKLFDAIMGWIEAHIAPEYIDLKERCRNNSRLWEYMCSVTYPNQPMEGSSHSEHLLSNGHTRKAFIMRLMVQHIVRSVFHIDLWIGFSDESDARLRETLNAMNNTEQFRSMDRQEILDQQAMIVQAITEHSRFKEFRQKKTNLLTEQFKQILGAMVNPEVSRETAATGLNDITWLAFEQAATMVMSRLHFGYVWNDTCSKFSHESHVALNAKGENGMTLQIKQMRLMLVITPGITTREDRGLNIVPKRVLKSTVLVMH